MTKDEAIKMAIKELSQTALGDTPAIQACKEALEQPAQELVGDAQYYYSTIERCLDDLPDEYLKLHRNFLKDVAQTIRNTYPAPSWQGLSDDDINQTCLDLFDTSAMQGDLDFAYSIEARLKEKNHE